MLEQALDEAKKRPLAAAARRALKAAAAEAEKGSEAEGGAKRRRTRGGSTRESFLGPGEYNPALVVAERPAAKSAFASKSVQHGGFGSIYKSSDDAAGGRGGKTPARKSSRAGGRSALKENPNPVKTNDAAEDEI